MSGEGDGEPEMRRTIALVCAALLALAGSARAGAEAAARPPLILISIDGFRWDYLDRRLSPNLSALAAGGVRAQRMIPSFPSVTFPNHYTLVTGLYPDHHGIVNNTFEDARMAGVFRMSSKEEGWWDEATPIWTTAEQHGIHAGVMFWPGSEAPIRGVRPSRWKTYDIGFPADARVDTVLGWLDLPQAERPGFLTLYFERVDSAGHAFGPDSPQVDQAIAAVDAAIGRLVAGLKARGIAADLIVVADHGMAPVPPDHTLVLDSLIDVGAVHVVFEDAVLGVDIPDTPAGRSAQARLLLPHDHLTCWRKADIPARFHYGTNPRVPDVICAAQTGWLVQTRERAARRLPPERGAHGYDNADPLMGALFVAEGPDFRQGLVIAPFPNVDVYPLMMEILGLPPEPNDGRLADLAPIRTSPSP
jgi:predicted AlkP superfamily pyrophosphatase or phosphodiesterase